MKHIKILFYATVREVTGISEFEIDLPDESTVIDLKTFLAERFPKITRAFPTIIAAVNQECVRDDYQLPHNSEIAFFPPVSGGNCKKRIPG
jgi:molybdopterin converting factor subunit 1